MEIKSLVKASVYHYRPCHSYSRSQHLLTGKRTMQVSFPLGGFKKGCCFSSYFAWLFVKLSCGTASTRINKVQGPRTVQLKILNKAIFLSYFFSDYFIVYFFYYLSSNVSLIIMHHYSLSFGTKQLIFVTETDLVKPRLKRSALRKNPC